MLTYPAALGALVRASLQFVLKVETGTARSRQSYRDIRKALVNIEVLREKVEDYSIANNDEYQRVRFVRNCFRDMHDNAEDYVQSRVYAAKVKEIDIHLSAWEKNNVVSGL